jgi:uncharacterized protein (DUF2249 family)
MELDWIDLDVRPMLAQGREPFALIINHLQTLEPGQGFRLTAPFHPAPLVDMMVGEGWRVDSRQAGEDEWVVTFAPADAGSSGEDIELDLRDLAPPEPMTRILHSLESLPRQRCLVALTPFRPENLLPILKERGFSWEIQSEPGNTFRITITHA